MSKRLTTEEFIRRAKEVHGDKYDYSKVEYKSVKEKVIIICKKHGEFKQVADYHLHRNGCPKCSGRNKSNSEFLLELIKIHGDKYDYSEINYINSTTKVILNCKKHGKFKAIPNTLLTGSGCPKCAGNVKLTTKSFIQKAKKIHSDKYNYDKTIYANQSTKVIIVCQKHGEFTQLPNNHIKGQGCPKCRKTRAQFLSEFIRDCKLVHGNKFDYSLIKEYKGIKSKIQLRCEHGHVFEQEASSHKSGHGCPYCANNTKWNADEVIEKFREVHGDRYDYSEVDYQGTDIDVTIICRTHGRFKQTPYTHYNGANCRFCVGTKLTKNMFITKAKKLHSDKYDYSKVIYKNSSTKIEIICNNHGSFWQTPDSHLYSRKGGSGCPTCNRGISEQYILNFVKSLEKELPNLTQQDYYTILQQSKILDSKHGKRLLKKPKSAIKDLLSPKKQDNKDHKTKEDDLKKKLREKLRRFTKPDDSEKDKDLNPINPKNILKGLDKAIDKIKTINSSADEEAIEYLKQSALNKLWSYAYSNPDLSLDDIKEFLDDNLRENSC